MIKICEYCGEPIHDATSRQKYHRDCATKAAKEREQTRYVKKPDVIKCARCGIEVHRNGTMRKYCPECAKIAFKEQNKAAYIRRRKGIYSDSTKKAKTPNIPQTSAPKLSLAEVDRLAKAEGLSYGQYSVKHGLYKNVYERNGLHI